MRDSLRHDQTLFRDKDVFDHTYLPEHLHHRDAQLKELAFLVSPALQGGRPFNGILRGPPGTGKTTTIRRIFAELKDATRMAIPVYVNCRQDHTPNAVYRCIAGEVLGYIPPSWHIDEIRDGIAARLRNTDARLIVCFDDANYLVAADTYNILLYQLLRLYEKWDDVRGAGVFVVTSDLRLNLYAEADGPVRSVFHPTEVNFWPYNKTEIRDILGTRMLQGLYPNVIPKVVLERIVSTTADEKDIRIGIDLVREAVMRAETDGRRRVTRGDVDAAARKVIAPVLAARAAQLTAKERAFLCWIARAVTLQVEMMAGAVFEEVQDYLPAGKVACHAYLNHLARAGFVDLVPGKGRGQEREIRLRYDPGDVLIACRGLNRT